MSQADIARRFAALHVAGDPVVLYNVWDAGTARAVAKAGARAIATGSWSVAAAHGYPDGEAIPLDLVERVVQRIVASVELPVSVDFEGGYDQRPEAVAANVARIIGTGAVGINFEDGRPGDAGLYTIEEQARRIAAIRRQADRLDVPLFINARTDLFLQEEDPARHAPLVAQALERAAAFRDAGGSGFFVPGLADEALIAGICKASPLPVNVMMSPGVPSLARLAGIGVARVSHGPGPYRQLMQDLERHAAEVYRGRDRGA